MPVHLRKLVFIVCTYTAVRNGCLSCQRQIQRPTTSMAATDSITQATCSSSPDYCLHNPQENHQHTTAHEHAHNNSDSLPRIRSALFLIWYTKPYNTFL